jgi:hypothetical protein
MDMKITKLSEYLKKNDFHHTKSNHLTNETKHLIYEARSEKCTTMSKRKFWSYLEWYGIGWSTMRNILSSGDQMRVEWKDPLVLDTRKVEKEQVYTERYHHTKRAKHIDTITIDQKAYIVKFREDNPNMWYKRLYTKLLQPKILSIYRQVFCTDIVLSKHDFYAILDENWSEKRITKRKKRSRIAARYKKYWGLQWYCDHMKYVYWSEKALHRWQVDIKYLIDIPNMLESWISHIYPYQLTFRDFKSGAVILFYGHNRDVGRTMIATQVFGVILEQCGINLKDVMLQYDWWAEFSTIRINGIEGKYIEYVKRTFKSYKIIERKEENGHVEAYHRICEEDFMDTKGASEGLRGQSKEEKKKLFLERSHEYVKDHNAYWFSSYRPRYSMFQKKSPIQIIVDDWWNSVNQYILKTYLGAYDVDAAINLPQKNSYKTLINGIINTTINESCPHYHVLSTENNSKSGQLWTWLYIFMQISL